MISAMAGSGIVLAEVAASGTRGEIAGYLSTLFYVYSILILIKILLSWVPRMPDNDLLRGAVRFVDDVTEPYLNLFRRLIPPVGVGGMGLDLSPIVALIVLQVAGTIIVNLVAG